MENPARYALRIRPWGAERIEDPVAERPMRLEHSAALMPTKLKDFLLCMIRAVSYFSISIIKTEVTVPASFGDLASTYADICTGSCTTTVQPTHLDQHRSINLHMTHVLNRKARCIAALQDDNLDFQVQCSPDPDVPYPFVSRGSMSPVPTF